MGRLGIIRLIVGLLVLTLTPAVALATNGYFAHGIGIKAKGMGGTAIALAQDAMVGGNNPGALAFVDDRLDIGVDWFRPDRGSVITGNANDPLNMEYDANGEEAFFMPEVGIAKALNDKVSLGLAIYGNGGMNTSYTTPIGLFGSTDAGVDLAQMFVVPTVAVKVGSNHAFGLGLNVVWQRFKALGLQNFDNEMFTSHTGKVTNNDYESSTGFGVRVGWMGRVGCAVTLGAAYQSRTFMGEFDEYAGLFAEDGGFDIPSEIELGVAVQVGDKGTVALDVSHIRYSEVNSIANPLLPNLGQSPLGTEDGAGFGWEDVTAIKIGVAYEVTDALTLRGGYNYGAQPIPESETLFNMLAPGVVESHVTVGGTWRVTERSEISVAYMHAFESTVEGDGSIIPGPPDQGGMGGGEADLTMSQDSFGLSYGLLF